LNVYDVSGEIGGSERGGTIAAPLTARMTQLSLLRSTCGFVRGDTDSTQRYVRREGADVFLQTVLSAFCSVLQPSQDSNRRARSGWANKRACDRRSS